MRRGRCGRGRFAWFGGGDIHCRLSFAAGPLQVPTLESRRKDIAGGTDCKAHTFFMLFKYSAIQPHVTWRDNAHPK